MNLREMDPSLDIPKAATVRVMEQPPGCSPVAMVDRKTGEVLAYGFVCGRTPRFTVERAAKP